MSDRIDHAAKARDWLVPAERPDTTLPDTEGYAAVAQAHATLALVEQQRIANLIALSVPQDVPGGGDVRISSYGSDAVLLPEVREALGLRE